MSKFHESKEWRKLSAEHKTFRCACKSKDDIQSAHYLPQKRFPLARLWWGNLYHSCGKCNRELGDNIYWTPHTINLLVIYAALWAVYKLMKVIYWIIIIFYFSLTTAVMVMDISTGGMETSFTGQILIETTEQIQQLWGML